MTSTSVLLTVINSHFSGKSCKREIQIPKCNWKQTQNHTFWPQSSFSMTRKCLSYRGSPFIYFQVFLQDGCQKAGNYSPSLSAKMWEKVKCLWTNLLFLCHVRTDFFFYEYKKMAEFHFWTPLKGIPDEMTARPRNPRCCSSIGVQGRRSQTSRLKTQPRNNTTLSMGRIGERGLRVQSVSPAGQRISIPGVWPSHSLIARRRWDNILEVTF